MFEVQSSAFLADPASVHGFPRLRCSMVALHQAYWLIKEEPREAVRRGVVGEPMKCQNLFKTPLVLHPQYSRLLMKSPV